MNIPQTIAWLVICVMPAVGVAQAAEPPAARMAPAPPTGKATLTISPATTYIVKPLRADGRPDYFAALERAASEGVTTENNAAVLLARVFGPAKIDREDRSDFLRKLGIADLPEEGDYFVRYSGWLDKRELVDEVFHQRTRSHDGPWSEQDCPLVARWLADNERVLTLATAASKRPRYYVPRSRRDDSRTFSYQVFRVREVVDAFVARSMLKLGKGDVDGAWEDLQIGHRLTALFHQGKSIHEGLQAYELFGVLRGEQRIGQFGRLTPDQVQKFRGDLARLLAIPPLTHFWLEERFYYLDAVCFTADYGVPPGLLDDAVLEMVRAMAQVMAQMTETPPTEVEVSSGPMVGVFGGPLSWKRVATGRSTGTLP